MELLEAVGFDADRWRLDVSPHPFAQGIADGDVRVTTRYDIHNFAEAYFGALHEFGHGLYEASIPGHLKRTLLGRPASLGVHESQSRLWENIVGRGRPFCTWAHGWLAYALPAPSPVRRRTSCSARSTRSSQASSASPRTRRRTTSTSSCGSSSRSP